MTTQSSSINAILENRKMRMSGPLPRTKMFLKAARVVEGLSKLSEVSVDFMSTDKALDLAELVGQSHTIMIKLGEHGHSQPTGTQGSTSAGGGSEDTGTWRKFMGTCIEAQLIGLHEGYGFYALQLRPWLWFLTQSTGCRIFQNQSTVDIIKKIFLDRGFTDYTITVSRTPEKRVYCVQYNETDYDFLCRLMEEEGMYFFSTVQADKDHLMIVDDIGAHRPVPDATEIEFSVREANYRRATDHIFEWRGAERVTGGKVSLRDYNFEKPKADLTTSKAIAKGKHKHKNYENYGYAGRYRETTLGDVHARVKMEAEACRHERRTAIGNVRTLATGHTFTLKEHERSAENREYLITGAVHLMQIEVQNEDESQQLTRETRVKGQTGATGQSARLPATIEFDEENRDSYRCTFESIPKNVPFRAPLTTEWPKIPGILLAKVTGPAGEEIYTDKYGRIKVQFPWDREGKNDENTSCWIRHVTPWSGKNWGMIHIPRIGQEVVIQFEDGDPDRPICTGMMYNADLMPPYTLPANMTQSGIVTRSTKGGSTSTFNELIFEDKKDAEFVRLQSEKDYKETIKNNAVITVGLEKKDPGDYTITIQNHRNETVKAGDSTFKVETGNEHRDIKTDKNEKIGQHSNKEVGGNLKSQVKGNESHDITGNKNVKITGTYTNDVTGSVTIESKQSITLKVGANSIVIDQSGITIKGIMIETNANGIAQHKAGGIMTIQGTLVKIN